MSSIDERIVKLDLDNKDFEKNASVSMKTLDRIKEALNFGTTSNEKSLSGISTAVENISSRFSNMGIVGMAALQNLTNSAINLGKNLVSKVLNPIVEGGKKRALNIEDAKFQLEGLGIAWKDISDDIDYGVKDTAYGLDAAAKAASSLVASGVKVGDSMKTALRGISGVAAMTNAQYEEIAPIFTTVAGQGKLMTMQLRQLETRGLNAAAVIGKQLGKTEAEVRDMVTKGKIDFETFAAAMDSAFGEHAKDANKTFTGAMSNVRAALARTGAMFATPIIQNAIPVLNALREKINEINKVIKPIVEYTEQLIKVYFPLIAEKIKNIKINASVFEKISDIMESLVLGSGDFIYSLIELKNIAVDVFNEMFPKTVKLSTGKVLKITKPFSERIDKFIVKIANFFNDLIGFITDNKSKIERIFKGFFAIFDIGITIIKRVGKVFKPVLSMFGSGAGGVLDLAASIGDLLVKLDDAIKKSKLISFIFDALSNGLTKIGDLFSKAKEGLSNFVKYIKESFSSKNISDGILSTLTNLKTGILNVFNNADMSKAMNTGLFGLLVYWIKRLSGNLFSLKELLSGNSVSIWKQFKSTLDQLKSSLFSWQQDLNAARLLKIAGAVAILAGALFVLSGIPAADLAKATISIAGLFSMLMGSLKIFDKFFDEKKMLKLGLSSQVFTRLATAILILSAAMKILSSLSWGEIARGVVAMAGICAILVATSFLLSKNEKTMKKASKAMIPFALSMVIFAAAFKMFAGLDMTGIGKSLLSMAGIMTIIGVFAIATKKSRKHIDDLAKSMVIFAASMIIFAKSFEEFSKFNYGDIIKSLAAMAGIFAEVLIVSAINKKIGDKNLKKLGVSMILIGAAMKIFANVISILSTIDGKGILTSLGAMGGLLALVLVFSKLAPKNLISTGAGLTVMALAIRLLTSSMLLLGKMSWPDILKGFATLAGIFVILGVAALVLKPLLPAIAALAGIIALLGIAAIGLGTGLTLLAKSIFLLGTMAALSFAAILTNMGEFVKSLSKIGKYLVGFTLVLTPLVPLLALVATSILFLGAGILALGVGLNILSKAIDLWESSASGKFKSILDVFGTIISGILETIKEYTPKIVDAALLLIVSLLESINDNIERITELAILIIANFIKGIADGLPALIDAGYKLIVAYIDGMATAIDNNTDTLIAAMDHLGHSILEALVKVFTHYVPKIKEKAKELILKAKDAIKEKIADFKQAAKDLIDGFIQGIKDKISAGVNAVKDFGSSIIKGLKKKFDEHSPSKVAEDIGKFFDMGFVNGIIKYTKLAENASEDLGDSTIDSLDDSLSGISKVFDNANDDFTIKPILDMSDINKKKNQISSMFGNRTLSLASSLGNSGYSETSKNVSAQEVNQFNFTQNNYSPKPLSRIDIYRQTKNQFTQLKEAIS